MFGEIDDSTLGSLVEKIMQPFCDEMIWHNVYVVICSIKIVTS